MNTKSINDKISQYPILNEVNLSLKLKNVSKRTILNYMDGIARFLDFISYDNQFEITSDMFHDYLIYLHSTSLKKNSINSNNSYIRFFFFPFRSIETFAYYSFDIVINNRSEWCRLIENELDWEICFVMRDMTIGLAHPTDIFWNTEAIYEVFEDLDISLRIAYGIKSVFENYNKKSAS